LVGSCSVGFGGSLATFGWHLLAQKPLEKVRVAILVALGSLLIAVGGYFTTQGWNLLTASSHRQALLLGVGRDWLLNEVYLQSAPIHFGPADKSAGELAVFYPKFKTSSISAVLTSPLFDAYGSHDDAALFAVLADAEMYTARVNDLLTFFNRQIIVQSTTPEAREQWYRDLPKSVMFREFVDRHKAVRDVLLRHHPSALPESVRKTSEGGTIPRHRLPASPLKPG
jgi:hypothetical protein